MIKLLKFSYLEFRSNLIQIFSHTYDSDPPFGFMTHRGTPITSVIKILRISLQACVLSAYIVSVYACTYIGTSWVAPRTTSKRQQITIYDYFASRSNGSSASTSVRKTSETEVKAAMKMKILRGRLRSGKCVMCFVYLIFREKMKGVISRWGFLVP